MAEQNNEGTWGVVELMGHLTLAGKITKPGDWGALWQIDIPEGDSFRTEFFGNAAIYRVRITSEEIARAYAQPRNEVIAYDTPIITRAQHENMIERAREQYERLENENLILRRRLTAVNALPSGMEDEDDNNL